MKSTLAKLGMLALLAHGSAFAAGKIPDGSHKGVGSWKGQDGKSGEYTLTMTVKDNVVSSVYQYDKKEETFSFKAEFTSNGFFKVVMDKHTIGQGYCGDYQCHYDINVGPFQLEETLTFWEGSVYRLGSKGENGRQVHWQEALESK